MDEFLLLLAEKGALQRAVPITTKSLGASFSMSQQNASVRLRKLEEQGFTRKEEGGIRITEKGKAHLRSFYSRLKAVFKQKRFVFIGKVSKGTEEAKYYVSLPQYKKGIQKCVGFTPFPGTLNIELDESQLESRVALREHSPRVVEGFKHKGRSFGPVELYPCNINGYKGAVIFPFRSHHGLRILELISPYNLAEKIAVSEGSKIKVEIVFT